VYAENSPFSDVIRTVTLQASRNDISAAGISGSTLAQSISALGKSQVTLNALNGDNMLTASSAEGSAGNISAEWSAAVNLSASGSNTLTSSGTGISALSSAVTLKANGGSNTISGNEAGINADVFEYSPQQGSTVTLTASADNTLTASSGTGISSAKGTVSLTAGTYNLINAPSAGISASDGAAVTLTANGGSNTLAGTATGISARGSGVELTASADNVIRSSDIAVDTGENSTVTLKAQKRNVLSGITAISAEGNDTGDESTASVTVSTVSGRNVISGGEAALSADTNGRILVEGPSTVTGAVKAEGTAASIELDYGASSAVTGDLSAASGASVSFAPQDGGSLVLTGSAKTDGDAESTINLNLSADSLWYMTASSNVTSLSGGGTVVYRNGGDALEIDTLTGSHTFALDLSTTGSESDMLYIVNGTSEKQTLAIKNGSELGGTMAIGDAVRFATIKNAEGGFGNGTELAYADGPVNYIVTVDYRDAESDPLNTEAYNDAYNGDGTRKPTTEQVEATYGGEGSSNVYVVKTAEEENAGGRTAGAAGKLVWRYTTDMDTYTRRMAQSTEFMPGSETGAWLRAAYHRLEADGSGKLHGPFWELGFSGDVRSSPERTHRVGFSAGYTVQSGSWAHDDGSVRVKDATAAFYYTMLGARDDAGASVSYWDNVLRYHHLRTHTGAYDEPSGANFDGNRTQEAVSLSTEYGRRIPLTETVTLTPQAQFQLTYVGGFDSTDSEGMRTEGDHDWSAVARIGADLSRRWGEGGKSSAYLKASLLHEFSDGQEIRVSGHSAASRYEHPGSARGSWAALGLGLNRRLGDRAYVYFDGETQIGSGRQNSYVFTGGFKYAF
jgi:outer membrane autotransporter protein